MKSIEPTFLDIAGLQVEVVRKAILHLRIAVYPPDGRVRVAAPLWVGREAIRLAVLDRLAWIRRHREKFANQPRRSGREMVNGETHWFQGRKFRLEIREAAGREGIALKGLATMEMVVRPGSDAVRRRAILERWYRKQLKLELAPLIAKWEAEIGVEVSYWGVRRMRTRWGSCNPRSKHLWFNLELVKKAPECLEYVAVHELIHILERGHGARFKELMGRYLPEWRSLRGSLNAAPLGQEPQPRPPA